MVVLSPFGFLVFVQVALVGQGVKEVKELLAKWVLLERKAFLDSQFLAPPGSMAKLESLALRALKVFPV